MKTVAIRSFLLVAFAALLAFGQTSAEYKYAQQELDTETSRLAELDVEIASLKQKVQAILDEVARRQGLAGKTSDAGTTTNAPGQISALKAESGKLIQQLTLLDNIHGAIESALPLLKLKLAQADECVSVYAKTVSEGTADVTVRQSEQIMVCKAIDMYPPVK